MSGSMISVSEIEPEKFYNYLREKPRILSISIESQAGIKMIAFISKYVYDSYRTYVR